MTIRQNVNYRNGRWICPLVSRSNIQMEFLCRPATPHDTNNNIFLNCQNLIFDNFFVLAQEGQD